MVLEMIDWITNKRAPQKADVEVRLINGKTSVMFIFTPGAVATKFRNSERVAIGVDADMQRVYFEADPEGYKLLKKGNTFTATVMCKVVGKYANPMDIVGAYVIKKDPEGRYYISIGAMPR